MQVRVLWTTLLILAVLLLLAALVLAQDSTNANYLPIITNRSSSTAPETVVTVITPTSTSAGVPTTTPVTSTPTIAPGNSVTATRFPLQTPTATATAVNVPVSPGTATPTATARATVSATNTLVSAVTATPSATQTSTPTQVDVTKNVERLGNLFLVRYPGDSQIYPRNVWDMQLFGNRIYFGSGNSSNSGLNGNAGPVDVWAFDLATSQFINEYTIDEEQIDLFRIINDTLYIPGHDPRTEKIGFYRLENETWTAYKTLTGFDHVYDMRQFGTELFAALGSTARVAISSDKGQSWINAPLGMLRVYSLIEVSGKLYAVKGIYTDKGYEDLAAEYKPKLIGLYEYQGNQIFIARPDLKFSVLFPGYNGDIHPNNPWYTIGKITRQITFQNKLIYIGGNQFNDHQTLPFGLFAAGPVEQAQRIPLPETALPWDTLVRHNTLYVLLSAKQADDSYLVSVISTTDLVNWTELFHFTAETFARSFELTPSGDFFFGLGTGIPTGLELNDWATWEMSPSAGDILRVSQSAVQK